MNAKHSKDRPARTGNPLLRLGLFAVLGLAIALAVAENGPRQAAQAAYDKVAEAIDQGSVDDAQVRQWMGREPARSYDGENKKFTEEYEFPGWIRTNTVTVEYTKAAAKLANRVELK